MRRNSSWIVGVTGFAFLLLTRCSHAEKPTRSEISELGKSVTAYVEVARRGSGSAFCIHPSGFFVTNAHVVGAATTDITIVLNPAQKNQRVFRANVVRVDKNRDLALLRAVDADGLPHVKLGSIDEVSELMDVFAFGFPLGRILATEAKKYPSISVNAGRVTALRTKDDKLQEIQIDVPITSGNSGGPVVNDNGHVIGVVVSTIRGAQNLNQAIPVSHLKDFLNELLITVTLPKITKEAFDQPLDYEASITSLLPASEPVRAELELVLKTADGHEQRHMMKVERGVYRVTASLPKKPPTVEVMALFEHGGVFGLVNDQKLRIGMETLRLQDCARIQFEPKPLVVLRDNKIVEGQVLDLQKLDIRVGGQTITVDLRAVKLIRAEQVREVTYVDCSIIARQGKTEVARFDTQIAVAGAVVAKPAVPEPQAARPPFAGPLEIAPPAIEKGVKTQSLPDTASNLMVGGGGRFFILHLPKLKKLAIFDVSQASIVRYLPLSDEKIVYAAGLEKVVVGLTAKGVVERWDLRTGELELSRSVPNAADITTVLLGSASTGPVFVNNQFFDLQTLKPLPIKTPQGIPAPWSPVSADGTVFGGWKSNQSPAESTSFVLIGDELQRSNEGGVGHVVPGPDGRTVFTAKGPLSNQLKGLPGPTSSQYCIPATEGSFYLVLTTADGKSKGSMGVHMLGVNYPLAKDAGIAHGIRFDGYDRELFGPWKRIFFVPRAKLIAIFPPSNDRLELHSFDLDAAMENSGIDYLVVTSQPPRSVVPGSTLEYQIVAKAKRGNLKFRLDSGPKGMELSPTGLLQWEVPEVISANQVDVIVTVRDGAGQELFHTFTLTIAK